MPESRFISRWFMALGGALLVLGAVLWLALPIRPLFPPFLLTALLALGYGFYSRQPGPGAKP